MSQQRGRSSSHNRFYKKYKKLTAGLLAFLFFVTPLAQVFGQETSSEVIITDVPSVPSTGIDQNSSETTTDSATSDSNENDPTSYPNSEPSEDEDTTETSDEDDVDKPKVEEDTEQPALDVIEDTEPKDVPTLEKSLPVQSDPVTGSLVYTYPIDVAPGRNQLQPDLKLVYNNQNSDVSTPFGYGWSTNIPYIERINKQGTQSIFSKDYFNSSVSGELASTSGSSYAPKTDDGSFIKYTFSGNMWTSTDKNGTTYKYGLNAGSRQDNHGNSSQVFRWYLEEVRDTNNNYIKYQYFKDNGQIYPDYIVYTGNNTSDGNLKVSFTRQSRPDAMISATPGFKTTTSYKISEIQIKVNDTVVKKYTLGYTIGDNGYRSMLDTITRWGQSEQTSTTVTLPAYNFNYSTTMNAGWASSTSWSLPLSLPADTKGFYVVDVNGDALPDVIHAVSSAIKVTYLNDGSGTFNSSSTWQSPIYLDGQGTGISDLNGDGRADIFQSNGTNNTIYLNNGAGWTLSSWTMPLAFPDSMGSYRIADINGDNLPDVIKSDAVAGKNTYLNNGDGTWTDTAAYYMPEYFSQQGTDVADLNGDGLTDLYQSATTTGSTVVNKVYLNHGNGFNLESSWSMPAQVPADKKGFYVVDVNGDGLPDVMQRINYGASTLQKTFINKGDGTWINTAPWYAPIDMNNQGSGVADLNGDGMIDVYVSGISINTVYLNTSKRTDFLTYAKNDQGGTLTMSYQASPLYRDGSGLLNPNLPFPVQTINKLVSNDANGTVASTTYSYSDGTYYFNNPLDRKFTGFAKVIRQDDDGNKRFTYYHTANGSDTTHGEYIDSIFKYGKAYRTENYDKDGNLYAKTINKWDEASLGTGRAFVKLAQTVQSTYDGDATHKDQATSYVYDNTNGNQTQKNMWGVVTGADDGTFTDTGSDKRVYDTAYASSTGIAVIGKPSDETLKNQAGTKIAQTRYYYDLSGLGVIGSGNETKRETWKSASSYASTTKAYSSFGLVTSQTDGNGKTTTFSYDSNNLYPTTITNPLSHNTYKTYDYSSGNETQSTDANGYVTQKVYDGFDRLVEDKIPDPTNPNNVVVKATYAYTDNTVPTSVYSNNYLDASTSFDIYRYFDGFGRRIQERKEAEGTNTFTVKDYSYNKLGLLASESLPYFGSSSAVSSATTTSALLSIYTYDPMQRLGTTTTSVGSTITTHADWKQTTTDPMGKQKALINDPFGNLVQVDEFGTTTFSTNYEYSALNNLTKITDANGNIRNFTYDGMGRRLTAQDVHMPSDYSFGTWTYTYDDAGNVTSQYDPKGQTVNFTYDNNERKLTENYTFTSGVEVSYIYDSCTGGIGYVCVLRNNSATTTNEYNGLGKVKKEIKQITGTSTSFVTEYVYDRQGNLTQTTLPDNSQVKYLYNSAGLLEKIQRKESTDGSFSDVVTNYDYAPTEKVTFQEYATGAKTTNAYDAAELYRLKNKRTYINDTGTDGGGMTSMLRMIGMGKNSSESISTQDFLKEVLANDARDVEIVSYDKDAEIQSTTKAQRALYASHDATRKQYQPSAYGHASSTSNSTKLDEASATSTSLTTKSTQAKGGSASLLSSNPPRESQNLFTEGLWLSENILHNSGFESLMAKWDFYSIYAPASTGTQDCAVSYSGSCSGKVIVSTAGNHYDTILYQQFRTDPNVNYKLKFKAKASTATTFNISVNQNHSPYYEYGLGKDVSVDTTWKPYEYDLTTWNFDENARVDFGFGAHAGTFWVDDVELVPDGLNKIQNPSFEGSYDHWDFFANGSIATNATDCVFATKGDCSNKTTFTSSGANWEVQRNANLNETGGVVNGQTYIVTFDAKASAARAVQVLIGQNSGSYNELTPQATVNLGTSSKRYVIEFTPNSTEAGARLSFFMGANTASVNIDNVRMWKKQSTKSNDQTPEFSEIYDDLDTGDTTSSYQIQVIKKGGSFDSPLWDSSKVSMSGINEGSRTTDIPYGGSDLPKDGSTYYWRVKLWDDSNNEGAWTNGRDYFVMAGKKVQDITYTYDASGNITNVVDASDTDTKKNVAYEYDNLNRLTCATATGTANNADYKEGYVYNAIGNILFKGTVTQCPPSSTGNSHSGTFTTSYLQGGSTYTPGSNPTTYEAWIKTSSSGYQTIMQQTRTGGYRDFIEMRTENGKLVGEVAWAVGGHQGIGATSAALVNDGNWHHVAMVVENIGSKADIKLFIDGALDGQATHSSLSYNYGSSFNYTDIGDVYNWSGASHENYFSGKIDDVRIWSTSRTQSQISANKNKEITTDPNLKGYWRLNNSASDSSGNGNTLAASNLSYTIDIPFGGTLPTNNYAYTGHLGTNLINPHAATTINGGSYQYDGNGNVTSGGGLSNSWDYKNRLTQTSVGGKTVTYAYDTNDQRVKYSVGTTTSSFYANSFYDIEGADIVKHILSGSNMVATVKGTGANAKLYPVHTDHISGTNVVSNASGSVEELADYTPYGTMRLNQQSSSFSEQRKFAGKDFDKETSLSYFGARYYDGQTGRFTSEDPAFLAVGDKNKLKDITKLDTQTYLADPQSMNSYSYARNNPLKYQDPDGQFLDTILDIGFIAYDTYKLAQAYNNGQSIKNESINLGLDVAGAAIPFVSGLGAARRTAQAVNIVNKADNAYDTVRAVTKTEEVLKPIGELIGNAGSRETIREINGSFDDAWNMFDSLRNGGETTARTTYDGIGVDTADGFVGIRDGGTKSPNTHTTIDINSNGTVYKLKYNNN